MSVTLCVCVCLSVSLWVSVCVCVCLSMCVYLWLCVGVFVYMCVCMTLCVCVCVFLFMFVCVVSLNIYTCGMCFLITLLNSSNITNMIIWLFHFPCNISFSHNNANFKPYYNIVGIQWKRNFATKMKEMRRRQGMTRKGGKSKNYQCGYFRRK